MVLIAVFAKAHAANSAASMNQQLLAQVTDVLQRAISG
jgi:hypothetical protein